MGEGAVTNFGWSYPPGISGNEYEIAGPDQDGEDDRWCKDCEKETLHEWARYRHDWWATCTECGRETDGVVGEEDWGA